MPTFDLTADELTSYKGSNPRPADFDEYWAAALDELDAVDPDIVLAPYVYPAADVSCFDLTFTGVRGSRIHAKLLRPSPARARGSAVLTLHGYGASSGDWFDKLPYAAQGHHVAAIDCRGQGGTSQDLGIAAGTTLEGHIVRGLDDAPDNLLFRHIFLDCVQLARILMGLPDVDPDRIGVTGPSQGGGLAIACAALEPRIRRVAPVYPFLCDYRRVWEMDLADQGAYKELVTYFRRHDPRHHREAEIFERLGYIDVQHLASRIAGEVLFTVALQDTVCPPSTQYAAYNKIESSKQLQLYPDFGHEPLPGLNDAVFAFLAGL